jgi:hypothetical protein
MPMKPKVIAAVEAICAALAEDEKAGPALAAALEGARSLRMSEPTTDGFVASLRRYNVLQQTIGAVDAICDVAKKASSIGDKLVAEGRDDAGRAFVKFANKLLETAQRKAAPINEEAARIRAERNRGLN